MKNSRIHLLRMVDSDPTTCSSSTKVPVHRRKSKAMRVLVAFTLITLSTASVFPLSHLFLLRSGRASLASYLPPTASVTVTALRVNPGGSSEPWGNKGDEEVTPPEASTQPVTPPQEEEEMSPPSVSSSSSQVTLTGLVQGPKGSKPGWLRSKFPEFPYHRLPDWLTYMRCAAIPVLCAVFYTPNRHVESGMIFAFASFTDYLDGFLARRWDISSSFGAFLDPVADKLMVSTALILLSGRHGAIVALPTCVIMARELAVSALREWMAQRGARDSVKVGFQGKLKTALTMVALTMMLLVPDVGVEGSWLNNLFLPSLAALYVCAVITVTSGSVYFRAAAPILMQK